MPVVAAIPAAAWAGAAMIGGSMLGAQAQRSAANTAADATVNAARESNQTQLEMFYQTRADLYGPEGATPWALARKGGLEGLQKLTTEYYNTVKNPELYTQSPGFNALVDRQMRNLGAAYSARGKVFSGEYPQAAGQMIHDLTLNDYNSYLNNLITAGNQYKYLASVGTPQATTVAQAGTTTAGNVGQNIMSGGNALANAAIDSGNAQTGLYSNIGNALNQLVALQYYQNRTNALT